MWVHLGARRSTSLDNLAQQRNRPLFDELHVQRRIAQKGARQIYAPYTAWVAARELLVERCFLPSGVKRLDDSKYAVSALTIITTATNDTDRHPVLRGLAMRGHHPRVFHLWRRPEPDDWGRIFSPCPLDEHTEFVVLRPSFIRREGMDLTIWGPNGVGPSEDRLADESVHLRFSTAKWVTAQDGAFHPALSEPLVILLRNPHSHRPVAE